MQPAEAMTLLIALGDATLKLNSSVGTGQPELSESEEQLQLALSVAQAMLNTALPVARFRLFVQVESGTDKGTEYTVCTPDIEGIISALHSLGVLSRKVYITLWEQRSTGAGMVQAYQGLTRSHRLRSFQSFVQGLRIYSAAGLAN